jgi:hypothetical protein
LKGETKKNLFKKSNKKTPSQTMLTH